MRGVDAAVDDGKGDAAGVDLEHPLGRVRFDGGPGFEQGLLRRPVQADEENPLRYLVLVVRRRHGVPQQALGTVVDVTQDGDRLQGRAAVCVRAQSIGQRAQRVDGLFRAGSHEVVDEAHESDIATELGVLPPRFFGMIGEFVERLLELAVVLDELPPPARQRHDVADEGVEVGAGHDAAVAERDARRPALGEGIVLGGDALFRPQGILQLLDDAARPLARRHREQEIDRVVRWRIVITRRGVARYVEIGDRLGDADVAQPDIRHDRAVLRPTRPPVGLEDEAPQRAFVEIAIFIDATRRHLTSPAEFNARFTGSN